MSLLRFLRLLPLAALGVAGGAQACIDGSHMVRYFSYQRPVHHSDTAMLRVTITGIEGNVVRAHLYGPFEFLSRDGSVRIEIPDPPGGGTCVEWGQTDGPVFVLGSVIRTGGGDLTLVATSTPSWPRPRRHSRAELESYIVDPSYLGPPPRQSDRVSP
jgi:hypothetical protein